MNKEVLLHTPVVEKDREEYEREWTDKMVEIWYEKIYQWNVRHTGALLASVRATAHGEQREICHKFLEYGIYQDRGTGKETPIDYEDKPIRNGGDIGRDKKRKKRPWFSQRFFPSVRKLVDMEGAFYTAQYQKVMESAIYALFEPAK